jgi:hypothetical protein
LHIFRTSAPLNDAWEKITPRRLDTEIKEVILLKLVAISILLYLPLYIIANIFT